MTTRMLRFLLAAALVLGGFGLQTGAQYAASASLTSAQKREITRLLTYFRRASKDPQQRALLIQQAIAFGPPAVEAVMASIERELHPQLKRYRALFASQAEASAKKQQRKVDLEETVRLRQTVLGLQAGPHFTKEAIVQHADPAMERLAKMFLGNRIEILAGSKKLQAERERVFVLGLLWERCTVYLHTVLPEGGDKPKDPPNFEKYLQGEEEIAVGLAAPMSAATRRVLATNAQLAAKLDPEEARAILALNLTRTLLGLSPVLIDPKLCAAARDHCEDMRRLNFFGHQSPLPGKTEFYQRAARFGAVANAENIFMGLQDGRAANLAWFHSPPHHRNMLGAYCRVGMGRAGSYFTEMFGK